MRDQGEEEPVHPGQVRQPLGARQGDLPVGSHRGQPLRLVGVLGAQQGGADRAEQVMPRRRPRLAVRAEPAQHSQLCEYGEAVPCRAVISLPKPAAASWLVVSTRCAPTNRTRSRSRPVRCAAAASSASSDTRPDVPAPRPFPVANNWVISVISPEPRPGFNWPLASGNAPPGPGN